MAEDRRPSNDRENSPGNKSGNGHSKPVSPAGNGKPISNIHNLVAQASGGIEAFTDRTNEVEMGISSRRGVEHWGAVQTEGTGEESSTTSTDRKFMPMSAGKIFSVVRKNVFTTKYWLGEALERFKCELMLLVVNWIPVALNIVVLGWLAQGPFRTIAFSRHTGAEEPLRDLGFEWIAELPTNARWTAETVMHVSFIATLTFVILVPVLTPYPHRKNIYFAEIVIQVMSLISVAHFLRFVTFVGTSLPGPADHCKPSYANYKVPDTNIKTILFRKSGPQDLNCGDLIFSGHVFQVTAFACTMTHFRDSLMWFNIWFKWSLVSLQWACVVAMPIMAVAARNHYTVDVVVSLYLAPLMWIASRQIYASETLKKISERCVRPLQPRWALRYLERKQYVFRTVRSAASLCEVSHNNGTFDEDRRDGEDHGV